jgi:hypothetical protein
MCEEGTMKGHTRNTMRELLGGSYGMVWAGGRVKGNAPKVGIGIMAGKWFGIMYPLAQEGKGKVG